MEIVLNRPSFKRCGNASIIIKKIPTKFLAGKLSVPESFRAKSLKMRDVVWTRAAEADLQSVYEEIEKSSESSTEKFLTLVDASIELLRQFPEMAPVFQKP